MRVESFKKQYRNFIVEMKDINSNKRIVILKGENGSGKSTLLKAICNCISYHGVITLTGTKSYMNELIVFPKDFTVKEVINGINVIDRINSEDLVKLIDQFDIIDKLDVLVSSLSKGMRMKLQLVCTFMLDRDVYILDEPFSGLDQVSVIKLMSYIKTSQKRFVIASHIDVLCDKDCDVILV